MGFLNDLFGDEDKRADMLRAERRRFEDKMLKEYLPLFESRMLGIIDQVSADQALDIESLQAAFQEQRALFDERVTSQLEEGFDQAAAKLSETYGQELEDISRATEAASLRSVAQGALSGLGMTTFGQAQTEAIAREGAREERRSKERFAEREMQLGLNRAQTMANVGQAEISLIGQQAGQLSDVRRSYTAAISGLGQQLASQTLASQSGVAQAGLDIGKSLVANVGTGFNLGEQLVSAGISAVTGSMGAPGG